jgi:hypothetical protein
MRQASTDIYVAQQTSYEDAGIARDEALYRRAIGTTED